MSHLGRSGLLGFLAVLLLWPGSPPVSAGGGRKISWQKPFSKNGATIIPGSVQTASGAFAFRWVVDRDGQARLVTLVSFGAGELPPQERRLLPLVRKGGTTLLFQEWLPLLGVEEPPTIRAMAEVPTAELFSVLPAGKQPPAAAVSKRGQTIEWGAIRERDGTKYLPGRVKASSGTLEIMWKKEPGRLPCLVAPEAPGAGELPPAEKKLYLWLEASRGATALCREAEPLLNEGFVPHLQCLAAVRTGDLLSGFRSINR